MNINATLILQSIAMMIFVWFCMKFIWPPLLKAMDERRERIAEGLAASDRAEKELEKAKVEVDAQIREARDKAGEIVDQANQRHSQIVDQAKEDATAERKRQVTAAEADITTSALRALCSSARLTGPPPISPPSTRSLPSRASSRSAMLRTGDFTTALKCSPASRSVHSTSMVPAPTSIVRILVMGGSPRRDWPSGPPGRALEKLLLSKEKNLSLIHISEPTRLC